MNLHRRLETLEARRASLEEKRSTAPEVLGLLSDEELDGLEEVMEAAVESGAEDFESLYAVVSERSRRSLDAYLEVLEAAREGRDLPSRDPPVEDRDAYRIWKHYRPKGRP